ncbi:type II secretion system protein GspD [Daejeonella oryzae]|uniref:type II secretion system protein GspD n=1 Tax=Daejeonella oryzae TaxID=1122943 RepID=UPI0004049D47|nr:general secretion pathway protein GspD [Daejeonella oryzae]
MIRIYLVNIFLFVSILSFSPAYSQQQDRIEALQDRLNNLSETVPGLNQKVQLSVTGASVQEFLRALAQSNRLNINIDPNLNFKIYNNFTNETALNILVFLAKEYNLDISFVGSILTITPLQNGIQNGLSDEIKATFNATDNTISLELNDDLLSKVARRISQISNKNIVITSSLFEKRVSGFFTSASLETVLEKLAFSNNIKLVKTSDNMYIFQSLAEGEEVYINSEKNIGVRKTFKSDSLNDGNIGISSRTVPGGQQLISVDATNAQIIDLVRSASQEVNKNYFLYSDIKGFISTRVKDISYDNFLGSLFQGTDYTYKLENGIYLIGERKLEGLRTNKVIQLQNRSIDTIRAMIPNEWRNGVEIREFREQNTILLSGSGPQIQEIESYIKQLDQLVPLILIEVTLIDVRKIRNIKTGIRAGVSDSIKTGGTILPGIDYTLGSRSINDFLSRIGSIGSVNLGRVTPNFYVGLSALEQNNNVDVRSVPKLSTLNGHSATLSIGSTRYYVTRTQNVFPSLTTPQSIFTEQFNKVEANLAISIRPIVSGDDQVTLNIKVDISDFIGIPPDNAPPPTSTSKFESIIRARNEDMIVLGGLERTEKSEDGSGTPFLSRIPVLKWLFSSRSKTNSKVVTIVFIKPTIIR